MLDIERKMGDAKITRMLLPETVVLKRTNKNKIKYNKIKCTDKSMEENRPKS